MSLLRKKNCFVKTGGIFFKILWPSHNIWTSTILRGSDFFVLKYFIKFRYYEKATNFKKISHLFWQNSCFYSLASKQVEDFFKFLCSFQKSWTLRSQLNIYTHKVQILREDHKNLKKISLIVLKLLSNVKTVGDCFKLLWPSQNIWTLRLFVILTFLEF